jgi:hypothetical protein
MTLSDTDHQRLVHIAGRGMSPASEVSSILMELPLDMRVLDKCAGGEGMVYFRSVSAPDQRRTLAAS